MNERFDITQDAQPVQSKADMLAQQPQHKTSRLALLVVAFVAACGLALGIAYYWRSAHVDLPPTYGIDQQQEISSESGTAEIDESNYEAVLSEMELEFQETDLEVEQSLDDIDTEFEAQFDSQ